jgi:hypothetical protein
VLAADFAFSLHVKGLLASDAPVHIARINYILAQQQFALADPYFGNNGVVDPRYSTNLLLGLQAVAADFLHMSAVNVWYYSYAFFRLLAWVSLFALAWSFLNTSVRSRWSYMVLGVSPLVYSFHFRYAEFPDRIVLVWISLLIIGLKVWLEKGSPGLLVLACILIAVTHQINSLMAVGFLGLLGVILAMMRSLRWRPLAVLAGCMSILFLPLIPSLYYPNLTASSEGAFTARIISGSDFSLQHYGPFLSQQLSWLPLGIVLVMVLLASVVYWVGKSQSACKRVAIFMTAVLLGLVLYSPAYISLVGYVYLLKKATNTKIRMLLLLLIFYYALLAYNPLFLQFAHNTLPPWLIARFQEFNTVGLLAVILGWLVVIEAPTFLWGYKKLSAFLYLTAPLGYVFVQIHMYGQVLPPAAVFLDDETNQIRKQTVASLEKLQPSLEGRVIYTNDETLEFLAPSIVPKARNVATVVTNYSPMANIPQRSSCNNELENLTFTDLQASGVTRVIINTTVDSELDQRAASLPHLQYVQAADDIKVYAVRSGVINNTATRSACDIPYRQ